MGSGNNNPVTAQTEASAKAGVLLPKKKKILKISFLFLLTKTKYNELYIFIYAEHRAGNEGNSGGEESK